MIQAPLEIDVYFHTEETKNLEKSDIDFDIRKCDIKKMTFYVIENIQPIIDNKHEYCLIVSGGSIYNAPYTYEEIKSIINKRI